MRYPGFLTKNGNIGVCAPSFGISGEPYTTRFNNAIKKFNDLGHTVITTESVRVLEKARSGSASKRAGEFLDLYKDKNVEVIISAAGGEFMCEILDCLDFNSISKMEPKWFCGNSDNTILTFLLPVLSDVASIHGHCASVFGMEKWHYSIKNTYLMLCGETLSNVSLKKYEIEGKRSEPGQELEGYNLTEKVNWHSLSGDEKFNVEGRVIGGNLDILTNLCGTKYDKVSEFIEKYKDDGIIWIVESCELNVADQLRAFWQLKNAGWFKYAKAIIIGRACLKDDVFDVNYFEANYSELASLNIPVVIDADFGHVSPTLSFINGGYAKVDYNKGKCKIEYFLK